MKSAFLATLAMSAALLLPVSSSRAQQIPSETPLVTGVTTPQGDAGPTSEPPLPAPDAGSHVRIVRLSQIAGDVKVDRNTGQGFEVPLLNLPVTEGTKLQTGQGFTEVEFEDDSTLRLTPYSSVEFTKLERTPSGSTVSLVTVSAGTVYVNLARTPGNTFTLAFCGQTALLAPSSHMRVFLSVGWASLAMFHGSAQVQTTAGAMMVAKNKTLNFQLVNPVRLSQNKNADAPYDSWDQNAIDYHNHYAKASAYGNSGNLSGIPDMSYYGRFVTASGCEPMWRPFFASQTWDPFQYGSWVWYPQWGYTWVSPYPWGWMPYHYGSWSYCPAYGWGWRPRGYWIGLPNYPQHPRSLPPRYGFRPWPHVPQPPRRGEPTITRINDKSAVVSARSPVKNGFVMRENSAGLGIPRETYGNLAHISSHLEERGAASMAVRSVPMTAFGTGYRHDPTVAPRGTENAFRSGGNSNASSKSTAGSDHGGSGSSRASSGGGGSRSSGGSGGSGGGFSSGGSGGGGHSGEGGGGGGGGSRR